MLVLYIIFLIGWMAIGYSTLRLACHMGLAGEPKTLLGYHPIMRFFTVILGPISPIIIVITMGILFCVFVHANYRRDKDASEDR